MKTRCIVGPLIFVCASVSQAKVNDNFHNISKQALAVMRTINYHSQGAINQRDLPNSQCYLDLDNAVSNVLTEAGHLDTLQIILKGMTHEDDRLIVKEMFDIDLKGGLRQVETERNYLNINLAGECSRTPLALQDGNEIILVIDRMEAISSSH